MPLATEGAFHTYFMVTAARHFREVLDATTFSEPAIGVLSTIGGVSMAGRFATGMIIDRIGTKRTMILCFVLLIVSLLWLQVAGRLWMLYLFSCIYGLAHGGLFTVISPMVAEWFGLRSHGALIAVAVCFGTIGGAIGPIVAGYTFDVLGSYRIAFWLITVIAGLGLGLLLGLKPIREDVRKT